MRHHLMWNFSLQQLVERVSSTQRLSLTPMLGFLLAASIVLTAGVTSIAKRPSNASANEASTLKTESALSNSATSPSYQVIGAPANAPIVQSIQKAVADLVAASNSHQLEEVLKHYSSRFTSGDNLSLNEIKKLILETWQTFPDIQYKSQPMEIRISGDWATVESIDTATATAKVDSVVSEKPGKLNSRSRGLLYLHRSRDGWEVMSDYTLFEMATITYGQTDASELVLSTPEQTFAGETYSAKLNIAVPKGVLAIATISQESLVYPQVKPKDRFRSLSSDRDALERIFQANSTNNNEIVTATVGLTQIGQDEEDRPTIKLGGLVTLVKRINVTPKSVYQADKGKDNLVRTSADGKVDFSKVGDVQEPVEEGTPGAGNASPSVSPDDGTDDSQLDPDAIPDDDGSEQQQSVPPPSKE